MTTRKITARDLRALEIINNGGRLVTALVRGWQGREQQAYWLENADRQRVAGFGYATFNALVDAGLLVRDMDTVYGSTCRRVFVAA